MPLFDWPNVWVIDATWLPPTIERNANAEYDACHSPGAVFFDPGEVCEPKVLQPHICSSLARSSS